jgi:hypothetical protein
MREDRKRIQTTKYMAALAITILIFISGILIGNYLGSLKANQVSALQEDIFFNTFGLDVKYDLLLDLDCEEIMVSEGSPVEIDDLREVGQKLTYLENQLGAKDREVRKLKEYYHLLEIRHFLLSKSLEEKCDLSTNIVLYFYAIDEICEACEGQGNVLTFLHRKNPLFNVYSFDITIDNPAVDSLKERYGIETGRDVPAIVFEGEVYKGFRDKNELARILFSDNSGALRSMGLE